MGDEEAERTLLVQLLDQWRAGHQVETTMRPNFLVAETSDSRAQAG